MMVWCPDCRYFNEDCHPDDEDYGEPCLYWWGVGEAEPGIRVIQMRADGIEQLHETLKGVFGE